MVVRHKMLCFVAVKQPREYLLIIISQIQAIQKIIGHIEKLVDYMELS